jgi:hypothetical protein
MFLQWCNPDHTFNTHRQNQSSSSSSSEDYVDYDVDSDGEAALSYEVPEADVYNRSVCATKWIGDLSEY